MGISKSREIINDILHPAGIAIDGNNYSKVTVNPWIGKYIFPNSMIPSMKQISESAEKLFIIEDWHNLGPDYDPTLMSWFNNDSFLMNSSVISGMVALY